MLDQLTIGTVAILVTIIGHAFGLLTLATLLKRMSDHATPHIVTLSCAIVGVVFIHTIEVWGWAGLFYSLGEFESFERALHFSAVTATTLGYGDIVLSEQWQVLSTFEAMGGLLLFGASTAFILAVMRRLFEHLETR